MRLNHYISTNSTYSRRQVDKLILEGRVRVNGKVASVTTRLPSELNGKSILIDGKPISKKSSKSFSAIVYHKPKGELVSSSDSLNRRLIYDSLSRKYSHFLPVGRLDFASEGLLILSDSKAVVSSLMHSDLERIYIIKIGGKVTASMINAMENGLFLADARAGAHPKSGVLSMKFSPFAFSIIKNGRFFSKLKVCIKGGQNRELRRFFAHFGAKVLDLRRVSYGFLNLNSLPVGSCRYFSRQEYRMLSEFMKGSKLIV